MKKNIPLMKPFFDAEEIKEIEKVLESGWVSQGPKVKEFEESVAEYLNVDNAVAVSNCTAALHLSLLCLGIQRDDEVLVADYTFPATGHSVMYCGAKPVFVDICKNTYNLDPEMMEAEITSKTRAVIPVHTFGQTAEMDEISKIAGERNLKIIEDAACAFGAIYRNKYAGTIGDVGCFSFHARKGITTGEGGMTVTSDQKIASMIRNLSVFGMVSAWDREKSDEFCVPEFQDLGFNYKMSDITAAVGVVQLKKLEKIIKRKRELAKYWDETLENMDGIQAPYVSKHGTHIYQSYVALVDKKINRNELISKLAKNGIQTQIGTYASHIQPVYGSKDECPNSLDIYNRALALPMYYTLEEEDIDRAATYLKKELKEGS